MRYSCQCLAAKKAGIAINHGPDLLLPGLCDTIECSLVTNRGTPGVVL